MNDISNEKRKKHHNHINCNYLFDLLNALGIFLKVTSTIEKKFHIYFSCWESRTFPFFNITKRSSSKNVQRTPSSKILIYFSTHQLSKTHFPQFIQTSSFPCFFFNFNFQSFILIQRHNSWNIFPLFTKHRAQLYLRRCKKKRRN